MDRIPWLALALIACGPRASTPDIPTNTSDGAGAAIKADDVVGSIGLATAAAHGDLWSYIPINETHTLVDPNTEYTQGQRVDAIGASGALAAFTAGAKTDILFGCEQNMIEVVPFAGPRLPPGPAWILPASRPVSWKPRALAITSEKPTPAARRYTIGPLAIDLTRDTTNPSRGTLVLSRDGGRLYTKSFERTLMDGAPPEMATLDLTNYGAGIPAPVAAWRLADGNEILVVMLYPGWEGVTMEPLFVGTTTAAPIDRMSKYLYYCAF